MTGFKALSSLVGGPWAIAIAVASAVIPALIAAFDAFAPETEEEKIERLKTEAEDAETAA
jgi:hypothetical protein